MGRPLNKKFLGDPALGTRRFPAVTMSNAWLPGQNGVAGTTVYILKQTGSNRYLVSDGTSTGIVSLVNRDAAAPGEAAMYVTPFVAGSETGATFTATYKVTAAVVHSGSAGTGYNIGNTISLGNGITLTVATLVGGAGTGVATVTVTAAGSRGTINVNAMSAVAQVSTNGSGTGATFDLTYNLNAVTIGGTGTGYTAGEALTFTGITATTTPTATIGTVNGSGTPQTITIGSAGTNITTSATSVSTSNSLVRTYARMLKNRTVKTFSGGVYSWDPYASASVAGWANIPRNAGTGTEASTYLLGNEAALANVTTPYFNVNRGVTPKQSQVFATAGVPGGSGAAPQATANVGTSSGGIYNPSSTQRKVNEKARNDRLRTAKAAIKGKSTAKKPTNNKKATNK